MKYALDCIPVISRDVIKRENSRRVFLCHRYSEEIFFISFTAYNTFLLQFDGRSSLGCILKNMGEVCQNKNKENSVEYFFDILVSKEIIRLL